MTYGRFRFEKSGKVRDKRVPPCTVEEAERGMTGWRVTHVRVAGEWVAITDLPSEPPPTDVENDDDPRVKPDWTKRCSNCGASPIVPATGLCGPCTFGEADTAGGNW